MINVIFWGIVALAIIIYRVLDDSAKFYLLLGLCIIMTIYGVYVGSTDLIVFFGIPILFVLIPAVLFVLYVIFHE